MVESLIRRASFLHPRFLAISIHIPIPIMKSVIILSSVAALAQSVAGHATFQELWVNGKDMGGTCARLPTSNSPVQDVTSNNIRCNINQGPAASKCSVAPGDTVTIEMHQQANDRSCANEAIGGAHYGPVSVYMSKVSDASTADGSSSFFKIFEDSWAKLSSTSQGSDDYWGTKDLNTNCGKMDLKIPANLAPGDYLLRAEALALHAASSPGGAQFYITCFQVTVTGSGTLSPSGVTFPGAYKASDPGIQINIYQALSTYVAPGPDVISGGIVAVAGKAGSAVTGTGGSSQPTPTKVAVSSTKPSSTLVTSAKPATSSAAGGNTGGCTAAVYAQCGGTGYTGCTACASGSTCKSLNAYYSQCQQ
ncbi:glycosyl hydrolase family 61-domain-containing protein [Clohesyomyces aquaticus]|uniref:AA9 family lytic polysaccharide monooxygenase n=1 Tax=Clohesyomyces aquaticus TaxID=1231657 RepID=A0A1Y1YSN3_9PLEO|nr:glycosyl hydrolase family 61-domain-containing protein [Clohesyomyces aquaticus]